jgi:hypothetical protein
MHYFLFPFIILLLDLTHVVGTKVLTSAYLKVILILDRASLPENWIARSLGGTKRSEEIFISHIS